MERVSKRNGRREGSVVDSLFLFGLVSLSHVYSHFLSNIVSTSHSKQYMELKGEYEK